MDCDSLSGLSNAYSATILSNRAVKVNVLQYVYWKGPDTGVSKNGRYGAELQTCTGSYRHLPTKRTSVTDATKGLSPMS
jgi:hypothetical protein